jgi:SepF-like predicted cell division protein (DUF552 family)
MVFKKIKKALMPREESSDTDYLEIDLEREEKGNNKVLVKPFVLRTYDEVNDILNSLREGYTIAVIDIKPLRQKDSIELKRAVAKIKKTTDAIEGSITGFGENIVIVTPSFATISRPSQRPEEPKRNKFD